jgi:transposase-like protein
MTRKQHSGQFKAKVVVEAIRGQKTVNELATQYGVHPVQISQWKRQALDGLPGALVNGRGRKAKEEQALAADLYEQIGRLQMKLEWVKKKCGLGD